jgi:hypothetical protein
MKMATKINRIIARRDRLQAAVDHLRVAVSDDYQAQGNTHDHAVSYTCGYIQSTLVSAMIDVMTPAQIQDVVSKLDRRREAFYAKTSICAQEAV